MPRIQIPQIDKPASRFDKVIGSDVDNASVTRNYQLGDILALFNSLSGGGIFSYRFTTALIDLDSIAGKMATVNGATDPDAVTSFRFSTSDLDEGDITSLAQNYEANSDSVVLKLTSESDPNLIAVYTITSVTATTNYVDIEVLQHKNFNSLTFVNHKDFTLSFDYVNIFGAASGATNTSQLTNDGEDGINPFITLEDILTDHTALSNIGTNTHEQIDVHISSTNIHYTQASISITESQISDLQTYLLNITGEPFGDLSDVVLTGVASGEIIKFTGTNWINNTLAEAGISGVGHGHAFSEITATPTTLSGYGISDTKVNFNIALSNGNFLFVGDAPTSHTHLEEDITDLQSYLLNITSESIGDLSDVTIGSPEARHVLVNNGGGGWTNRDLVELDISDLQDYLKLDQTTPQTIINGIPDFSLGLDTEHIQLDTSVTPSSSTPGLIEWNSDEDTADLHADGITYQLGQEISPLVKNQTGSTITNGTPVRFSGTLGASGRVLITPAIADGTIPSSYILGLTTEDISNGSDGHVTTFGKVRQIDTTGAPYGESWSDGDLLYVSPTTAGNLTNVPPEAPNPQIFMGVVILAHVNNGSIFTRPSWRGKLTDLEDVDGTPLTTTGQIIVWNNTNSYFDFTSNISDFMSSGQQLAITKSLIVGQSLVSYDSVTGLFTSSQQSYTDLSNIPSDFTPSPHTHTFASLTSKPTTISGYGITDYNSLWDTRLGTKSTTDLSEGTNLYYTDARVKNHGDTLYEVLTAKGANNGYAPLDNSGKLPTTHLPALAISDTFVVATEAAMLLLTAETGDVAVRTDENKSYILQGTDPTLLTDWQELLTPTDAVQTVNGLNGTVILDLTFNNGDLSITGGNSVDLDLRYSILGHTHTFASLTSKPTTIGGYGITDFVSLGDVEWMQIGQQLAVTKSLISGEFFTSYDSSTGLFTSAQASYTDLSNIPTSFAPSVHAHGSYDRPTSILSGANVFSDIVVTDGIVGTIATRAMTLSDLGYTGATDANKYVHPNHTGDVTSVADGATTIVNKKVTLAKMADMATASIIGRNTATTGIPEILSAATVRTIINVADGATIDQTSIVGISGTKSQFNTELSNGNFMFIGDDPTAHTHTFASLTSKPTTIGGYGITDFNSLGDARWLGLTAKAADSNLLDGVDSGQFLRKDSFNGGATGSIQFNDNFSISFGDVGDMTIKHSGGNNLIDMLSGNLIIRDNTTTRFTFGRTTGNFTLTGQLISSVAQNNGVVFESSAFINKTSATTNTTGVSTIALRTSVAANQGYSMSALRRDTSANADMIWKNHDNSSAGVETMRLTKEGNLTIRNSNDAIITIISNITGNSEIWFGDTDDQNIGRIRYEHASNKLEFWINNAERASISNTGNFVTSGTSTATNFIGNWSGLNSGQFLRSDENTTKTGGNLTMKDGLKILFGTSSDMQISHEGAIPENRIRLNNGNLVINDTGTTRFTFGRTTGNFTATGDVTANGNLVTPGTLRVGGTSDSWVLGEFGLGTTAPSSKLHLFQNANSKIQIKIQNDNTGLSATSAINILSQGNNFTIENFGDGTSKANVTELGSTATGSVLSFLTANVERMTIFDKGLRIGGFISGHTGSGAKLQVNGFMRVGSIYIHEGGTGTILTAGLELGNLAGVLRWDGSPIITGNNANSELGQFLRSDVADNKTAGELKFFDNVILRFGSSASGSNFKFDGTNTIHTLLVGDLIVKDNTNTRFTFGKTSGNFTATGTMTATNFILSSDKRLKTKITPVIKSNRIHTEWVNFELKSELGQNRYGVIAQELEIHHPEFIRTGENGEKSVAYIDLLIAKNIELEDKLDNMEARMLKMEELIKTLI